MVIPTFGFQETFALEEGDDLFSSHFEMDRIGSFEPDIDLSPIEGEVTGSCKEICNRKFKIDYEDELESCKINGLVNAIVSVTGDDEIIATDSPVLGVLHFVCAKHISEVELSEKDTGISKKKGNYAEGWILMPPHREASIDAINRRHKSSGVPVLMDTIKMKQISAVRKQSSLETDFESKYKDLYKSVEWIHPKWITYDYGQLALVLATAIFDFRKSIANPYLSKTEGGCGGKPPWNNLDTALAGIEHMSQGKATKSLLWIMSEASAIQNGRIAPKDASFVNASHYAQRGSKPLAELKGLTEKLQTYSKEDKINLLESVRDDEPVPQELKELSIVVQPKDKLLGCAISELRKNGLVMTELDLQTEMAKRNKYAGLLGRVNMGTVVREQRENLEKSRKNSYRILASIGNDKSVPEIEFPHKVMMEYYKLRSDISDITAFSYAGEIRIFKASDVLKYYESQAGNLRDEIAANMPAATNYRQSQRLSNERSKVEYQIEWMNSGEITELFEGELPPGIGSDDARIMRKISLQLKKLQEITVFVIITGDKQMVDKIKIIVKSHPLAHVLWINKNAYMEACMNNKVNLPREIPVYNYLTGKEMSFSGLSSKINRFSLNWRKPLKYQILWDFPNLERGLETVRKKNSAYYIPEGGFLRNSTIQKDDNWKYMPWNNFKAIKDFQEKGRYVKTYKFRSNK